MSVAPSSDAEPDHHHPVLKGGQHGRPSVGPTALKTSALPSSRNAVLSSLLFGILPSFRASSRFLAGSLPRCVRSCIGHQPPPAGEGVEDVADHAVEDAVQPVKKAPISGNGPGENEQAEADLDREGDRREC